MNDFNPEMLILARESRELTQAELSRRVDVNQGTVSRIEGGLLQPSPELWKSFAHALEYDEQLFAQTDRIYGFNAAVFFHRKRQSLADKVLRRLHATMNLTRMRVRRLLRSIELKSPLRFRDLNPAEYGGAEKVAQLLRSMWQLPPGPVRNVTQAIEGAGGIVVRMDLGTRQVDAISEWIEDCPPIFLLNSRSDISGDRWRLTLAHEIAHVVMHRLGAVGDIEDEANKFAAEFLMPRREIKASLLGINMPKLANLKLHWKVSMQALIMRAYELKTITDSQRRYLFINIAKRAGGRIHEPLESEMPREEANLFLSLIRSHQEQLGYTTDDLTRFLFIKRDELETDCIGERGLRLV